MKIFCSIVSWMSLNCWNLGKSSKRTIQMYGIDVAKKGRDVEKKLPGEWVRFSNRAMVVVMVAFVCCRKKYEWVNTFRCVKSDLNSQNSNSNWSNRLWFIQHIYYNIQWTSDPFKHLIFSSGKWFSGGARKLDLFVLYFLWQADSSPPK